MRSSSEAITFGEDELEVRKKKIFKRPLGLCERQKRVAVPFNKSVWQVSITPNI